jgi:hypothetical protein
MYVCIHACTCAYMHTKYEKWRVERNGSVVVVLFIFHTLISGQMALQGRINRRNILEFVSFKTFLNLLTTHKLFVCCE